MLKQIAFAHTKAYYFSYFPHTMSVWNCLDSECVTSSTYSLFMNHLRSSNIEFPCICI